MYFEVDSRFKDYFNKRLRQVFLYINDKCNLRCSYCYYKANLAFNLVEKEIPLEKAVKLISDFKEMGASKLTILGGEPTIYGFSQCWKPLLELIAASKNLGYEYVRIDTNGTFNGALLEKSEFKMLDEITFSFDSHIPEINDVMRGQGVFQKCLSKIKLAVQLGYNVNITSCAHKANNGRDEYGELLLHKTILFAESLGVKRINFHPIFKMGVPRDTWIEDTNIHPHEWVNVYNEIQNNVEKGRYNIVVRIPQRFITREEFNKEPEYYGYCPVKLGGRVLVHPNGIIRICALMIGTPHGIGGYFDDKIEWDGSLVNETRKHKLNEATPCSNQTRNWGKFVPLCISFKPNQDEFVWKDITP